MKKETLFVFILCSSLIGYGWIAWNVIDQSSKHAETTVCLFKAATGIPCPACGTTRAVVELMRGNILDSLSVNPFGVLVAIALIVLPLWILIDRFFNKDSLFMWYSFIERTLSQRKSISIPVIIIVGINWIWNIIKGM